jgi:pimeloyl-ACP methyl ester carboxylesterase
MNPDIAGAFVDALAPAVCEAEALKRARMRLRALILAPGRTGGDVAMLRIALPDLDAFVCASRVPVVVFHGSADTTVDPSWPSAWVRATTAAPAELHELPDVGHYPALHVPELVAEILRSLAARQPSAVTTAP